MVLPGHLAAGYLTTFGVLDFARAYLSISLSKTQTLFLFVVGTLLGDGPDIDVFFGLYKSRSFSPKGLDGHRKYLTHAPILWLLAGVAIFCMARICGSAVFQVLGLLVWLAPWSHFLCDSIENGVMWLWPFSHCQFALLNAGKMNDVHPVSWRELFAGYLKNPVAWVEMLLVVVAVVVFLKQLS